MYGVRAVSHEGLHNSMHQLSPRAHHGPQSSPLLESSTVRRPMMGLSGLTRRNKPLQNTPSPRLAVGLVVKWDGSADHGLDSQSLG